MAPDRKEKKRKAATTAVGDSPAKKSKNVKTKATEAAKDDPPKSILKKNANGVASKETKADLPLKLNGEPTRQIKPRKRAADFHSDEENDEPAAPTQTESSKKSGSKKAKAEETIAKPAGKKAAAKGKKIEEVAEESEEEDADGIFSASEESEQDVEEDNEDDQTAALIKGFESSGDEAESEDEGYNPDQPVPRIPDSKKTKRKILKKQKKTDEAEAPGTVYVGRIPHGFYEHQMRAYFSQFGELTRLRLSRNRITGRAKHYAFVEFASTTVAKIVAETMDNYLMYGHILKCKYVPQEQLHPEIWKGANRRFKRTPWNRIEKKRLEKGKTREQWSKRIEQEQKRRQAKADKLKALGYEVELPQLKSVNDVPVQEEPKAIETVEATSEEPVKAIEAPATSDEAPKKTKQDKKARKQEAVEAVSESPATKIKGKAKKASKAKAKA